MPSLAKRAAPVAAAITSYPPLASARAITSRTCGSSSTTSARTSGSGQVGALPSRSAAEAIDTSGGSFPNAQHPYNRIGGAGRPARRLGRRRERLRRVGRAELVAGDDGRAEERRPSAGETADDNNGKDDAETAGDNEPKGGADTDNVQQGPGNTAEGPEADEKPGRETPDKNEAAETNPH